MNAQRRLRWAVCPALLLLVLLTGCLEAPPRTLTFEDRAEIYAAVIERLYGVENGVIPQSYPVLYIAQTTDDRAGDHSETPSALVFLPNNLQEAIQKRLTHLPAKFTWVPTSRDIPWEADRTRVKDGGGGVTLGNIQPQADGKIQVAGSLVEANLAGHGTTYILEKRGDHWVITGTNGVMWIS